MSEFVPSLFASFQILDIFKSHDKQKYLHRHLRYVYRCLYVKFPVEDMMRSSCWELLMNNLTKTTTMFTTIQREKHVPNFADTAALARLRKETPKGTLKCKRTINLEGCRRKVSGQKGGQISKGWRTGKETEIGALWCRLLPDRDST